MPGIDRSNWGRELVPVEPARSVDLGDVPGQLDQGRGAASCHGHVQPGQVHHAARVERGPLHIDVPADGGDAEQVEMPGGEENRHRIVVPGIAIQDHRAAASRRAGPSGRRFGLAHGFG